MPVKRLFTREIFSAIFSLLTHTIEWIDLWIICAKLYEHTVLYFDEFTQSHAS